MTRQVSSIILPDLTGRIEILGTEVETVADALEHTSMEFPVAYLEHKTIHILATEVVAAGVPGVLNCWVELSPVLTTLLGAYWGAIGGGGGAMPALSPVVEVGVGVNGRVHNILIPWTMNSPFARLVIQTPVPVATAFWLVQALVYGEAP